MNNNSNYLDEFKLFLSDIKDKMTDKMILNNQVFNEEEDLEFVKELNEYFSDLNRDGKFIRASLIALSYLDKCDDLNYIDLAYCYETFQSAILVHDDIIDHADFRRGKKCIHKRYLDKYQDNSYDALSNANGLALCAGDLGLFYANKILGLKYGKHKNFYKVFNLYNDIVIHTIKGEVVDVILPYLSKYREYITKESDIYTIYKLKTSWYTIVGPYLLGSSLAGYDVSNELVKALENIGIAFQIKDDLLGIFGDEKVVGKPSMSDVIEYKQTILYSYTLNTKYKDELLKYYGKEDITIDEFNILKKIFKDSGSLEYCNNKISELLNEAYSIIDSNTDINSKTKNILFGLIEYMKVRKK